MIVPRIERRRIDAGNSFNSHKDDTKSQKIRSKSVRWRPAAPILSQPSSKPRVSSTPLEALNKHYDERTRPSSCDPVPYRRCRGTSGGAPPHPAVLDDPLIGWPSLPFCAHLSPDERELTVPYPSRRCRAHSVVTARCRTGIRGISSRSMWELSTR